MHNYYNAIASLILGLLSSGIVALIYGALLAQREGKLRARLRARRHGRARRRYVRIHIEAVQGKAAASDSSSLALLVTFLPLIISFTFTSGVLYVESKRSNLDSIRNQVERAKAHLNSESSIEPSVEQLLLMLGRVPSDYEDLPSEIEKTKARWGKLLPMLYGVIASSLTLHVWLWVAWQPYVGIRSQVSYEVNRITLRAQGLASKAELAQLIKMELKVKDEESLKRFVIAIDQVAARHKIPNLAKKLNLW